ncbi:MAG: hypothetical protein KC561_11080 [Myxococcales bacterium]|nr:hypothetical protein [Myxococcales bacterium]
MWLWTTLALVTAESVVAERVGPSVGLLVSSIFVLAASMAVSFRTTVTKQGSRGVSAIIVGAALAAIICPFATAEYLDGVTVARLVAERVVFLLAGVLALAHVRRASWSVGILLTSVLAAATVVSSFTLVCDAPLTRVGLGGFHRLSGEFLWRGDSPYPALANAGVDGSHFWPGRLLWDVLCWFIYPHHGGPQWGTLVAMVVASLSVIALSRARGPLVSILCGVLFAVLPPVRHALSSMDGALISLAAVLWGVWALRQKRDYAFACLGFACTTGWLGLIGALAALFQTRPVGRQRGWLALGFVLPWLPFLGTFTSLFTVLRNRGVLSEPGGFMIPLVGLVASAAVIISALAQDWFRGGQQHKTTRWTPPALVAVTILSITSVISLQSGLLAASAFILIDPISPPRQLTSRRDPEEERPAFAPANLAGLGFGVPFRRTIQGLAGLSLLALCVGLVLLLSNPLPHPATPRVATEPSGGPDRDLAHYRNGATVEVSSTDPLDVAHPLFVIDGYRSAFGLSRWTSRPGDDAPRLRIVLAETADLGRLSLDQERFEGTTQISCSDEAGEEVASYTVPGSRATARVDVDCPGTRSIDLHWAPVDELAGFRPVVHELDAWEVR